MALLIYRNFQKTFGIVLTALAILSLANLAPAAHASDPVVTITFDDVHLRPGQSANISNPYHGFTWTNLGIYDPAIATPSGYLNGIVSGSNIVADKNAGPASLSSPALFTLNSFDLTSAWNDGLSVAVTGVSGNTVRFVKTFTVDTSGPTLETLNWTGLTQVNFTSFGGTNHGYAGAGEHFAMDNVTITTSTPEPAPMAALAIGSLGLLGLGLKARRRRTEE